MEIVKWSKSVMDDEMFKKYLEIHVDLESSCRQSGASTCRWWLKPQREIKLPRKSM